AGYLRDAAGATRRAQPQHLPPTLDRRGMAAGPLAYIKSLRKQAHVAASQAHVAASEVQSPERSART
ncbi:MAG TPA: hypothetical protein VLW50_19440, partial [Streptosporangiaceae bacterium]|nr:hypothetical protein [Streptosporangiaceae bacterium]